ncbi:hypothetical protein E4L96_10530 [Massilia arenosa]|uniref:DUF5916 domain-containing protein n=1 Tax=Zemynaea arenosa TaxID=2561931 RepID=A0A4Y9SG23_9BURK|nr:carbohydrate binding family 9 domain-containing protein [Massilia arenosa]TFW20398.1 hypothetical protein E4L96_10530 [Massilia arenosa]
MLAYLGSGPTPPPRMNLRFLLLLALAAATPAFAEGQCERRQPQAAEARALPSGGLQFDGRLDEGAWRTTPALTSFYEYFPGECSAPTEDTEARFLYDERYLYIGFTAHLHDREQLRTPFVRRDKVGSSHDYIQAYIDPSGTGRSSYIFRVNARGTRTDGITDETRQTESMDPDYEWEARTAIGPDGWTAELRIPLATLRVPRGGAQTWRVIVTRGVPRGQNTQMATAPFPHDASCFLCLASPLHFDALPGRSETVFVTPSLLGVHAQGGATHLRPSLDAKWLVAPGSVIDLTLHPDFAQVESDTPVLTANQRFSINLPEKRPFFREGAELLTGSMPLIYTRTIVEPSAGLRITHRDEHLNATAFLARDTGRGVIVAPSFLSSEDVYPDFDSMVGFARVVKAFGNAQAGALASIKRNADGSRNVVASIDGAWNSPTDRVIAQAALSDTRNPRRPDLLPEWRGQSLQGHAALIEWDHSGPWVSELRATSYAPGFRAWLGDVPRVGFRSVHALLQRPWYVANAWINSVTPYVGLDELHGVDHVGRERDPLLGLNLAGPRNFSADLKHHPSTTVLNLLGQERAFSYNEWSASFNPAPWMPLVKVAGLSGEQVDFDIGDVMPAHQSDLLLRAHPLDRFELELHRTQYRLAGGRRLDERIDECIASWYFGAAVYLVADMQRHQSQRPPQPGAVTTNLSVQLTAELSSRSQLYAGVRDGRVERAYGRKEAREAYIKYSRTLAW